MENTQQKSAFLPCLVWIVICLSIATISGWVTQDNVAGWYSQLQKPSFNPPAWVFGPVWTVLYILIGISGGLLWTKRHELKFAFSFYLIQLLFNFAWSFIFFGMHQITAALVDMILLLIFLALTIIYSFKKARLAAYLLMPYFVWICFALLLNFCLWQLNA